MPVHFMLHCTYLCGSGALRHTLLIAWQKVAPATCCAPTLVAELTDKLYGNYTYVTWVLLVNNYTNHNTTA